MFAANDKMMPFESQTFYQAVRPWLVCLSAALFFFYEFIQMHMFNSISPGLMTDFSLDAPQLGVLSSSYLLADVFFLLPAGLILDRFSTRKVILLSMSMCIAGTVGFAMADSFWLAGIFHFISGVGNAFCFLSCILLTTHWFPSEKRALVVGVIVTMAMTGGVVAQWPLATLSGSLGWRHALLVDAVLGFLIIALIWAFVEDYPETPVEALNPHPEKIGFFAGLIAAGSNSQNWLAGLYTSFLNLPIMLIGAVYGDMFLQQVHHLTIYQATTATEMLFLGTIVGSPLVGYISDKDGERRWPMLVGAMTSIVTMIVLTYAPVLNYTYASMGLFLLGLFTSTQVLSYPLVAESNAKHFTATAMALTSVLIMGGATIAQPVFGYLMQYHWDHTIVNNLPVYSAMNYHHGLMMILGAFFVAMLCGFRLRETHCQPYTER